MGVGWAELLEYAVKINQQRAPVPLSMTPFSGTLSHAWLLMQWAFGVCCGARLWLFQHRVSRTWTAPSYLLISRICRNEISCHSECEWKKRELAPIKPWIWICLVLLFTFKMKVYASRKRMAGIVRKERKSSTVVYQTKLVASISELDPTTLFSLPYKSFFSGVDVNNVAKVIVASNAHAIS